MILNKGHGQPVDWWAFGILLYEMIVGIDPFTDEDPMNIYKKIVRCKYKFPRHFDKKAKSLVKHLLKVDLSKRYGNLKGGVRDIKKHRFFSGFNWISLLNKKIKAPYKPKKVSHAERFDNSASFDVDDAYAPEIKESDDPFINW
mmetsp:Transcript_3190/g.3811  ORF Transcript_3190/g.3811 Transcript_3190/m.3811 type:complete len:144 (-) Transcript_3190:51-482(-)